MDRKENIIASIAGAIILVLLIVLFKINQNITEHCMQYLNGFWVYDDIDSKCIIYVDTPTSMMRVITIHSNNRTTNEQLNITFTPRTWMDMYMRRYQFVGKNSQVSTGISGKHAKILTKSKLHFDVYSTEGVMILADANGDLITFVKDNSLNMELAQ